MNASVLKEIEGLRRLTVGGLREKYREVFGEESRSNHKDFLFRRIAWRLQANAEGGLSERARRRARIRRSWCATGGSKRPDRQGAWLCRRRRSRSSVPGTRLFLVWWGCTITFTTRTRMRCKCMTGACKSRDWWWPKLRIRGPGFTLPLA